jgi:uncharacterized membrane protein YkvA (DUF1232 family)
MGDGYRSAAMDDLDVDAEAQARSDEATVRAGFWPKLKRVAAKLPFAEDLVAGYYCAFDRETPRHVQIALLGAIAYFVFPADVVPDMLPMIGFTDDAAILATVLKLVSSNITSIHRAAARRALDELAR